MKRLLVLKTCIQSSVVQRSKDTNADIYNVEMSMWFRIRHSPSGLKLFRMIINKWIKFPLALTRIESEDAVPFAH